MTLLEEETCVKATKIMSVVTIAGRMLTISSVFPKPKNYLVHGGINTYGSEKMFFDLLLKRGVSPQEVCCRSFFPVDFHERPYVPYAP